jgi:RNA exonuclease 1
MVHETIIDTSLVFPHARGQPYKRALRTLMSDYLTKIIQENGRHTTTTGSYRHVVVFRLAQGHDSMEDAISCMELMLWKVKQDLKTNASSR